MSRIKRSMALFMFLVSICFLPFLSASAQTITTFNGSLVYTQGVRLSGGASIGGVSIFPFSTGAGNTSEWRLLELAANGVNYIGFKAPDSIAANLIWTMPSIDAAVAGAALTSNAAGVLSWGAVAPAPLDATYVVISLNGTLTNERVITGTTNQINITDGGAGGNVTLATPQNIHTGASPTFTGLTLTGLTANSFIFSGAGGLMSSTAAPTNGQLLIGSTGLAPTAGTPAGVASEIDIAVGAGTITIGIVDPLIVGKGGTGLPSGTSGGILGFTGTTTLASSAALTANGVVLGGGAGATPTSTAAGAANQVFRVPGVSGAPTFGAVDLAQSAAVTGTLARTNGGTGTAAVTTDGQLLIGNTATGNWSVNTLTAGSNITITNGNGTITIAGAAAGANTALSNLASVAINTALLPNAAGTIDLGSDASPFRTLYQQGATAIIFEGATANAFETTLSITDPTVDATITLHNNTGTVAVAPNTGTTFIIPVPPVGWNGTTTLLVDTNTLGYTGAVMLPHVITVNKLSIGVSAVTTAGTLDIGIYSESGQTKEIDITTASISAAGSDTTTVSPAVTLSAGIHWVVVVPNGTANITLGCWQGVGDSNTQMLSITSEPRYSGTQAVSAGTLPTTFDPAGTITAGSNRTIMFRLDN